MLERLLEQKKAITASNAECQPPTELRSQQWALAEKVVKLLKVFEEATREISGEYCSASVIIPIINTLKRTISQVNRMLPEKAEMPFVSQKKFISCWILARIATYLLLSCFFNHLLIISSYKFLTGI